MLSCLIKTEVCRKSLKIEFRFASEEKIVEYAKTMCRVNVLAMFLYVVRKMKENGVFICQV